MGDVAAFDFDGTLTNGGSVIPFLVAVTSWRRVLTAVALESPRLLYAAIAGGAAADAAKQRLFERVLAGVPAGRLDAVGGEFARRHLDRRLRVEVKRRLDWHRARGDRVVVVSASLEAYVAPAAHILGADGAVATRLEVGGDALTGRYQGANCRGEEKLRRLDEWIDGAGAGERTGRIWAYGNSRGDVRLLDAADVGVNLGRLGRFGRLRGFPSLAAVSTREPSGDPGR
jgi:phosphatidylglycerophosphatase C